MKRIAILLSTVLVVTFAKAQEINEIHYDNAGTDVGEFIEILFAGGTPSNPEEYAIELINSSGTIYESITLDMLTPMTGTGGTYYAWYPSSIQNGADDGMALCGPGGSLIEALSYEGTTTATSGCSMGVMTTDIGVREDADTPAGTSIQKQPGGAWIIELAETPGALNNGPLPVELTSFNLSKQRANAVLLSWSTASEINTAYFEILKSRDGKNFAVIGTVQANGNSSVSNDYSFIEEDLKRGLHYYRLNSVDQDGSNQLFDIESVVIEAGQLVVYPTLAQDKLFVDGLNGEPFRIYNSQGQRVLVGILQSNVINLRQLIAGKYYLGIGHFKTDLIRFVKL